MRHYKNKEMVDTTEGISAGPIRIDGMSVFFRMMAGAVGGAAGTLVIFMGILLGGSIIGSFTSAESFASTPLAVFFMLTVLLFAGLAASGLSCFLIGLTNTEKYVRIPQGLLQVLLVNVVIFIMIIPVYFVVKSVDPLYVLYVSALHFLFSALTSAIVFEIMATERRQVLLGVYGVIISVFSGFLLLIVVFYIGRGLVLFFSIPVVLWLAIGFIGGAVEYFYYQIYKRSGVDFLGSTEQPYATVAGEEEQKAVQELK